MADRQLLLGGELPTNCLGGLDHPSFFSGLIAPTKIPLKKNRVVGPTSDSWVVSHQVTIIPATLRFPYGPSTKGTRNFAQTLAQFDW